MSLSIIQRDLNEEKQELTTALRLGLIFSILLSGFFVFFGIRILMSFYSYEEEYLELYFAFTTSIFSVIASISIFMANIKELERNLKSCLIYIKISVSLYLTITGILIFYSTVEEFFCLIGLAYPLTIVFLLTMGSIHTKRILEIYKHPEILAGELYKQQRLSYQTQQIDYRAINLNRFLRYLTKGKITAGDMAVVLSIIIDVIFSILLFYSTIAYQHSEKLNISAVLYIVIQVNSLFILGSGISSKSFSFSYLVKMRRSILDYFMVIGAFYNIFLIQC